MIGSALPQPTVLDVPAAAPLTPAAALSAEGTAAGVGGFLALLQLVQQVTGAAPASGEPALDSLMAWLGGRGQGEEGGESEDGASGGEATVAAFVPGLVAPAILPAPVPTWTASLAGGAAPLAVTTTDSPMGAPGTMPTTEAAAPAWPAPAPRPSAPDPAAPILVRGEPVAAPAAPTPAPVAPASAAAPDAAVVADGPRPAWASAPTPAPAAKPAGIPQPSTPTIPTPIAFTMPAVAISGAGVTARAAVPASAEVAVDDESLADGMSASATVTETMSDEAPAPAPASARAAPVARSGPRLVIEGAARPATAERTEAVPAPEPGDTGDTGEAAAPDIVRPRAAVPGGRARSASEPAEAGDAVRPPRPPRRAPSVEAGARAAVVPDAEPRAVGPHAADAGETAAPAPAATRPLAEQVASRLRPLREGRQEVTLRLDPPELGGVRVEAVLQGRQLTVRITAEQEMARSLLQSSLPQLRESLAGQGFATDQVSVQVALDQSPREFTQGRPDDPRHPAPLDAPAAPPPGARPGAARGRPASVEGLDLWV